jgi:nucleotide-binding universal stress UspA family protein
MLSWKRILVPTDFSEQALGALDVALEAVGQPADVTVLHVAPPLASFAVGDPMVAWTTVDEESREEHILTSLDGHLADPRYKKVQRAVAFGNPADEITGYAQEHQFDAIVLPSHGRTGLARLMIGSVAEHVVRLAHCPVLVLRD